MGNKRLESQSQDTKVIGCIRGVFSVTFIVLFESLSLSLPLSFLLVINYLPVEIDQID